MQQNIQRHPHKVLGQKLLAKKLKYKKYFRKTSLKQKGHGDFFLAEIEKEKPKFFLEVGVFHGVTARNICELLHEIHKDDFKFACPQLGENKFLIMDPFSSFYLQDFTLDFIQDYENDLEGFEVINHDQKEFHGKFWKKEPHKVPQLQKS